MARVVAFRDDDARDPRGRRSSVVSVARPGPACAVGAGRGGGAITAFSAAVLAVDPTAPRRIRREAEEHVYSLVRSSARRARAHGWMRDDIVQEAALKVFMHARRAADLRRPDDGSGGEGQGRIAWSDAYVYRVVRNATLDMCRSLRREEKRLDALKTEVMHAERVDPWGVSTPAARGASRVTEAIRRLDELVERIGLGSGDTDRVRETWRMMSRLRDGTVTMAVLRLHEMRRGDPAPAWDAARTGLDRLAVTVREEICESQLPPSMPERRCLDRWLNALDDGDPWLAAQWSDHVADVLRDRGKPDLAKRLLAAAREWAAAATVALHGAAGRKARDRLLQRFHRLRAAMVRVADNLVASRRWTPADGEFAKAAIQVLHTKCTFPVNFEPGPS